MDCPAEDHSFLEEMTTELRPEGQPGFIQGYEEEREFLARDQQVKGHRGRTWPKTRRAEAEGRAPEALGKAGRGGEGRPLPFSWDCSES